MSKHNRNRQPYQTAATITTAADGTIIGRMDDLQKQFSDMRNAIDLSQRSPAVIQAGMMGLVAARRQGRVTVSGDDPFSETGQFTPGQPMLPQQSEERPRSFAYMPGTNLTWIPRSGYGLVDYPTLRALGFASKEIRLNYQMVKRTIRGLGHEITQKDKSVESYGNTFKAIPPNYDDVIEFWKYPDGYHCFDDWVDLILEDALVCGASTIYKEPDPEQPKTAQPVDVTTWRILTDISGRIPQHPAPAFIQTTYGRASFWCSRKHLLHSPLNPTIPNPYGFSATEFIIQAVVQSIKRDASRTGAFTEGNVPAAFVGLPTSWTVTQIKEFTDWFNGLIQGDVNRSNKIMFVPHDGQGIPVSPFSSIDQNQTGLDEWLLKVAAWAVGNNPAEFGLTSGSGLGGKGALDAGENAQYRGSTAVYTQYISRIVEQVSTDLLDAPWVKSTWQGMKPEEDEIKSAAIETARINSGVWSVAFVQDKLGYDRKKYATPEPPTETKLAPDRNTPPGQDGGGDQPAQDQPAAMAGPGHLFSKPELGVAGAQVTHQATRPAVKIPANFGKILARAAEADLLAWRDKVRYAIQKGLSMPVFKTDCIPDDIQAHVIRHLETQKLRRDQVDEIFSEAITLIKAYKEKDLLKKADPYAGADNLMEKIEQALQDLNALEV